MTRRSQDQFEELLIDRAAAAEVPKPEAVRDWAREKRAFISSVMGELADERQSAAAGARAVGVRPILFEEFGGRDADPEAAYLGEVEGCDIYIGILGNKYGRPLKTRYSPTHTEYLHALKHGLRMAIWTSPAQDREGPEQSFLDEVRVFHVVPEFRSNGDLQRQIEERLQAIAAEELAPWCKLGNAVFRCTEVDDRGDVITLTARVRDDRVARALEEARGGPWNRGANIRFTWAGRSRYAKVEKVHIKTTASRSKTVSIELAVQETPHDQMLEISFNGKSAAELTEIGLRSALFGEPNPLPSHSRGFVTEFSDPLKAIRENPVSEEIIRPISELLLADALIGTGRAKSIRDFRLGVPFQGKRKLTLAWETPTRYETERAELRTLTGDTEV